MSKPFTYKGHQIIIAPFHLGHPNQWPPVGDAIYIDGKHRCAAPRRGAKALARKLIDAQEALLRAQEQPSIRASTVQNCADRSGPYVNPID